MSEQKLIQILSSLPDFSATFLNIREESGAIKPFIFNRMQMFSHERIEAQLRETGKVRVLALKGRKMGFSTYAGARGFKKVSTERGQRGYILTHEMAATDTLFGMVKMYYDMSPNGLFPRAGSASAKELSFPSIGSGYGVGTAGNKATGRSQTIQWLHGSEVAFWPNAEEHSMGILEAVPNVRGTEIILESTANGMGNYFYDAWISAVTGKSEYMALFLPWYWKDENRTFNKEPMVLNDEESELLTQYNPDGLTFEHLVWRRNKINSFSKDFETGLERFKQEYPFSWIEAFRNPVADRFIKSHLVERARKNRIDSDARLVIGVDPAISDTDRLAIIRRRGRKLYKLETRHNLNTMEIVGFVVNIIKNERPDKVCVDCIGIGAGVVDRLLELGYGDIVEAVNVARSANDKEQFKNKRAELCHEAREWLAQEMSVEVPDSDEFQADCTSFGYKYDSGGRLVIESKEELKKRGMKSPDCFEAFMLTFAVGDYIQTSIYKPTFMPEKARGMLT